MSKTFTKAQVDRFAAEAAISKLTDRISSFPGTDPEVADVVAFTLNRKDPS